MTTRILYTTTLPGTTLTVADCAKATLWDYDTAFENAMGGNDLYAVVVEVKGVTRTAPCGDLGAEQTSLRLRIQKISETLDTILSVEKTMGRACPTLRDALTEMLITTQTMFAEGALPWDHLDFWVQDNQGCMHIKDFGVLRHQLDALLAT